jgi:hypothetical protein
VQLVETGEDIEVGVTVEGAVARSSATVLPETAVELAKSLLDHAERAGAPSMAMTADLATLLGALEDVSITDEERHSLRWLARLRRAHRGAPRCVDHPRRAQLDGRPVAGLWRAQRPPSGTSGWGPFAVLGGSAF